MDSIKGGDKFSSKCMKGIGTEASKRAMQANLQPSGVYGIEDQLPSVFFAIAKELYDGRGNVVVFPM